MNNYESYKTYKKYLKETISELVHLRGIRGWEDLTDREKKQLSSTALRAEVREKEELFFDWLSIDKYMANIMDGAITREDAFKDIEKNIVRFFEDEIDEMIDIEYSEQYGTDTIGSSDITIDSLLHARDIKLEIQNMGF